MTKSITISYNPADESLLMAFFERLKIQVEDDGVPQRVATEIVEGLKNVAQFERGEIELEDAYDFLKELRQDSMTNRKGQQSTERN